MTLAGRDSRGTTPIEALRAPGGPDAADLAVRYVPILDVARGTAAGFQTCAERSTVREPGVSGASALDLDLDGVLTAAVVRRALAAAPTLPVNTFLTLPIGATVAASAPVRAALTAHGSLGGIVLDLTGYAAGVPVGALDDALAAYRRAGALVAIGGHAAAQPELTSIVRFRPAIIRLGRDWIRGIDTSATKRDGVELIGQLAGQADAWVLAEGVDSPAELRALAGLGVPLAQGAFIGSAHEFWPPVTSDAATVLPRTPAPADGALRELVAPAYTTRDAAAAMAVLPEASGFDLVVVLDADDRPRSMLVLQPSGTWEPAEVLAVHVDTPVPDAVARAMARPRPVRFTPPACTDASGRFLGVLPIERLMAHLAQRT